MVINFHLSLPTFRGGGGGGGGGRGNILKEANSTNKKGRADNAEVQITEFKLRT